MKMNCQTENERDTPESFVINPILKKGTVVFLDSMFH